MFIVAAFLLRQDEREVSPATTACHLCSILYVLKFIHKKAAPKYDVPIINQLRGVATSLQRQGNNYINGMCINFAAFTLDKLLTRCSHSTRPRAYSKCPPCRQINLNIIYIRCFQATSNGPRQGEN